ncbi:hypothetical protein DICPUDRAFT_52661 [Dictyostelium purpureum]|uniref:Bisphosphate nucleotidase n=1 Tax=Dictyostelium purpureum TaxID=5786 RepID=F0Z9B9_DICPU|nr:uncharacterized protein DICPUDRAFT_52661 [Dictyostelium purpureum]EGC39474.1 hypothetical protein DICPUDRAFT_52661 [Dictyostelium purpureum]|eukprot:XP_003284032.1 hypothetical protein DICPUDRAFT_52661 [Dictyostelium purpureum]
MAKINILELLSACKNLAEESGEIITSVFKSGDLNVQMKGEDDPMTQADLLSQQHIIGGLNNLWSDLIIVGEESCEIPKTDKIPSINSLKQYENELEKKQPEFLSLDTKDLIIFIDPLDATREFTNGRVGCVMTLIGISYKGKPIAGVIYQPFVDADGIASKESSKWVGRSVWAVVGLPVVGLKDKRAPEDVGKVILVTTASHNNQQVEDAINKIKPDKLIRTGGAGYKTLMVIENLADVYVFPTVGTKLWDICGPHAILLAINGSLTDPFGNEIVYTNDPKKIDNKYGVVITIGDHQKYINLLNQK